MRCLPSQTLPPTRRMSILRSISLPTFAVPREVSGQPTLMGRPRRRESGVAAGQGDLLLLLRGLQREEGDLLLVLEGDLLRVVEGPGEAHLLLLLEGLKREDE